MNHHATALANIHRELAHISTVPVYFAQAEWHREIKIGFSTDTHNRMYLLSSQRMTTVSLLGWLPGGIKVEREMHARFADFSLGREWFAPDESLLDFIKTSTLHTDPPQVPSIYGRITDWGYDSLLSNERVYSELAMKLTG